MRPFPNTLQTLGPTQVSQSLNHVPTRASEIRRRPSSSGGRTCWNLYFGNRPALRKMPLRGDNYLGLWCPRAQRECSTVRSVSLKRGTPEEACEHVSCCEALHMMHNSKWMGSTVAGYDKFLRCGFLDTTQFSKQFSHNQPELSQHLRMCRHEIVL